jgi:murein tripeptide amidase MpaA
MASRAHRGGVVGPVARRAQPDGPPCLWQRRGPNQAASHRVFHGTVHAREWIATMVVEYLAFQLAEATTASFSSGNATTAADLAALLEKYDVYAFPIVNPDGFVYTQTTDRLWRKNRQTNENTTSTTSTATTAASASSSTCIGRDINRKWPIAWAVDGGASVDPCAQDYRGGAQADAPETGALTSWLLATHSSQTIKLYIDYHAYGQLFMTPYGYTCETLPANNAELQDLATGASDAICDVHGVYFQPGGICSMLYKSTGNSVDYVHDVVGVPYSFTSELRDMSQTGFVLPPAQIQPSCEEAFAGVVYLLKNNQVGPEGRRCLFCVYFRVFVLESAGRVF